MEGQELLLAAVAVIAVLGGFMVFVSLKFTVIFIAFALGALLGFSRPEGLGPKGEPLGSYADILAAGADHLKAFVHRLTEDEDEKSVRELREEMDALKDTIRKELAEGQSSEKKR